MVGPTVKKKRKTMKTENFKEIFPSIVEFYDVVDDCDRFVNLALSPEQPWREAAVGLNNNINSNIRSNRILNLLSNWDNPVEWFILNQIVWKYADIYGKMMGASFYSMDDLQLLHYRSNEDFYQEHSDDGPGLGRVFSSLLYLNNVDQGGETYFTKFDLSIKPQAGKLVFFPSNYPFSHEAKPPEFGEKFVAVTWFYYNKK